MNQLTNCPICGKLYLQNTFGMCTACYQTEEQNEFLVADYVRDHPNATIFQVHEATGIKESIILRMIKSGRLIDVGIIAYPCESCGASITKGRLCEKCNLKLLKEMQYLDKKKAADAAALQKAHGMGLYTNFYKKKDPSK